MSAKKTIKVKVKTEYRWEPEAQVWKAKVTYYIPTENGEILPVLRNKHVKVAGHTLYHDWAFAENSRERSGYVNLEGDVLQDVISRVKKNIQDNIARLREVARTNREFSKMVPPVITQEFKI